MQRRIRGFVSGSYGGGKIVESHCTTEPLAAGSTEEKRYPLAYNAAPGAATKTADPKSISLEIAHWKLAGQQHCHVLNTVGNRQALLGFLESETSLRATNLTVGEGSIRLNAQGEKCDMIFLNFKPN
ncbi:hypothetical protein ACPRNU_06115 [Chromobacterium vaccinii]|uniref:hypothetical protein n=1 Tax=Chromobacterium vaccinii TaxID=1108595 RepID=UPI003C7447C6